MTYGNATDLSVLVESVTDSVSANRKAYALEIADTWVNSKLPAAITGTVPDLIEKAATLYAYVFIMRTLDDTAEVEAAAWPIYQKQAEDFIGIYVEQNATEESTVHPYSGSLTPTNVFTQRVKKTVRDDTNYDDVDDTRWDSEG